MGFQFNSGFVNSSPVSRELAGEEMVNGCHMAVGLDVNGDVVIATSGAEAMGLLLSSTAEEVALGEEVDVLWKDVGLLVTAEAVPYGSFVTIAEGKGKVAVSGDVIFGRAMTASYGAGDVIQLRIGAFGSVRST